MIIKLVIMINLAEFIKIITTTTLTNIDIPYNPDNPIPVTFTFVRKIEGFG